MCFVGIAADIYENQIEEQPDVLLQNTDNLTYEAFNDFSLMNKSSPLSKHL